jgi:transcriptional regulator with XRE-family HTH domain
MTEDQAQTLGKLLRQRRETLGLSLRQLAAQTRMSNTTILRMEKGQIATPSPIKLSRLAQALRLNPGDLFTRAYFRSHHLPNFGLYLRTKYPKLPETAISELRDHFKKTLSRHGLIHFPNGTIRKRSNHERSGGKR